MFSEANIEKFEYSRQVPSTGGVRPLKDHVFTTRQSMVTVIVSKLGKNITEALFNRNKTMKKDGEASKQKKMTRKLSLFSFTPERIHETNTTNWEVNRSKSTKYNLFHIF